MLGSIGLQGPASVRCPGKARSAGHYRGSLDVKKSLSWICRSISGKNTLCYTCGKDFDVWESRDFCIYCSEYCFQVAQAKQGYTPTPIEGVGHYQKGADVKLCPINKGRKRNKMLNLSLAEIEQRQAVLDEVSEERTFQDSRYGGPEHDDQHSSKQWLNFIADRAMFQVFVIEHEERRSDSPYSSDYRATLIKIAALAVAGIQSHDRNKE